MRFHFTSYAAIFLLLGLASCQEKMTENEIAGIGILPCRKPAAFIQKIGLDPNRCAFSTEGTANKGVLLLQAPAGPADTPLKTYQHPSWSQFGYMASVTTDEKGNAYCYPIPVVNTMDHTLKSIHSIYKIDGEKGEMKLFTSLPPIDSSEGVVPFGLLGIYYDCHGKKIYASSVGGSTRDKDAGKIYIIDPQSGKVLEEFKSGDAMGLCVGGVTGEKRLFYGKGRLPEVWSVELDKAGFVNGSPRKELSLDQLGPRGDDKARKIRLDKSGNLIILGIEFNYSLAAQSKKPETAYLFGYDRLEGKWILLQTH